MFMMTSKWLSFILLLTISNLTDEQFASPFLSWYLQKDLGKESLFEQFLIVKNETLKSHPQQYGNLTMANATLDQFQSGSAKKMAVPAKSSKLQKTSQSKVGEKSV